jgi:AcrR family transcriptional regulator
MVKEPGSPRTARKTKKRVPRGTLSRELIIDAAFRMIDENPDAQLTLSRLGRELGADPSAVYRHFRSKDDLLRAMVDVMMQDALDDVVATKRPLENIRRMAWALRRSFLRRPGLTRFLMARYTGGDAEAAWALAVVSNVEALGFDARASNLIMRSIGEIATSHMTLTAEVLALPDPHLAADIERARNLVSDKPVRLKGATGEELRALAIEDGEVIFDCVLELLLDGLASRAPARPRQTPARRSGAIAAPPKSGADGRHR